MNGISPNICRLGFVFCPNEWGSFEPFTCQDRKDNLLPIRLVRFCVSPWRRSQQTHALHRDAVVLDEKKRGRMDFMDYVALHLLVLFQITELVADGSL